MIEVLIAITILSVISGIVFMGVKLAAESWRLKENNSNLEHAAFKFYSRLNKNLKNAVEIEINKSNLFLKDKSQCYVYQIKDHSIWMKKIDISGFETEGSWPQPISNYSFNQIIKLTPKRVVKSVNYENPTANKYKIKLKLVNYDNKGNSSGNIKEVTKTFYNRN